MRVEKQIKDKEVQAKMLSGKIERLIDQRNALQKLINVLDEERIRLEKPHLKGENIDGE